MATYKCYISKCLNVNLSLIVKLWVKFPYKIFRPLSTERCPHCTDNVLSTSIRLELFSIYILGKYTEARVWGNLAKHLENWKAWGFWVYCSVKLVFQCFGDRMRGRPMQGASGAWSQRCRWVFGWVPPRQVDSYCACFFTNHLFYEILLESTNFLTSSLSRYFSVSKHTGSVHAFFSSFAKFLKWQYNNNNKKILSRTLNSSNSTQLSLEWRSY